MFWILNRLRGRYAIFAKVSALYLAAIVFFATANPWIALACGVGYLVGEAKGWGVWVGALVTHGAYTPEYEGFRFIERLARLVIKDPRDRWLRYCRVCLFLRGLLWWLPVFIPLFFAGYYAAPVLALALAVGFPLACETGYRTNFSFKIGAFEAKDAWGRQELFYGAMQDAAFLILWTTI
jgi:hypothetical protein|nr:MAG TPA: hypothetical protein [Caudoviricetes sp.]DAS13693.1 MAG TPA: hypothetical protein [Caudoviricetes sp.]